MKKTVGSLIDELSITNVKIFYLVAKVQSGNFEKEDAKKIQDLNRYRSELVNEINKQYGERLEIKV